MTGGRFHRIRSAAAAKCPERPKLPDFHTAWANTGLGRLDVALDLAATNHWTVVDMKRDWKVMFPFQKQ
jgi:hypothetical protein